MTSAFFLGAKMIARGAPQCDSGEERCFRRQNPFRREGENAAGPLVRFKSTPALLRLALVVAGKSSGNRTRVSEPEAVGGLTQVDARRDSPVHACWKRRQLLGARSTRGAGGTSTTQQWGVVLTRCAIGGDAGNVEGRGAAYQRRART